MPTEAPRSLCAGLDLHKRNVLYGLIDQESQPIYRRHLPAATTSAPSLSA